MTATSATLLTTLASRSGASGNAQAVRLASVLFMTVLTAAAAQVSAPLPFTPVPFTFQPMIVLLSGLVLGSRLGAASQVLYLAAGVAGLPVFAGSIALPPGALRLLGPTGGYLLAYPLAAFVTGGLAERGFDRRYVRSFLAMLAGLVIIYAGGAAWLGLVSRAGTAAIGLPAAFVAGVAPFVVPDLIKLALASAVVPGIWRLTGRG
jgi:biotin transport system substrate-specific component